MFPEYDGFMPSYNCWTKHGEKGVVMEDNEEEEDDDNYHNIYPEYDDKVLAKRVLAHETDGALKVFSDLLNI